MIRYCLWIFLAVLLSDAFPAHGQHVGASVGLGVPFTKGQGYSQTLAVHLDGELGNIIFRTTVGLQGFTTREKDSIPYGFSTREYVHWAAFSAVTVLGQKRLAENWFFQIGPQMGAVLNYRVERDKYDSVTHFGIPIYLLGVMDDRNSIYGGFMPGMIMPFGGGPADSHYYFDFQIGFRFNLVDPTPDY